MTTASAPPPQRNAFARLVGVLWEPKATFQDIAARPGWLAPLIVLALMSLAFNYAFTQRVGWERYIRQQIDTNPRAQARLQSIPQEQRERILEQQARFAPIGAYVVAVVFFPFFAVVAGGAFLFVFKVLLSAQLAFRQVLAVVSHALLPQAISTLMALAVLFMKDPNDFDLQRPTLTNIGAFLDPLSTPKWMLSLASSIDAFTIWVLLLLATGFSVAARKISWATSLAGVLGVWAVYVLIKAGWVAMFG